MNLKGKTIGFGLTGSHCTFEEVLPEMKKIKDAGARVIPIVTSTILTTDTKFGTSEGWVKQIEEITGEEMIDSIVKAEPLGPAKTLDLMLIAPMTGNSTSKLANALTDNPVMMAAKSTMRNQRPLLLAISTNDGLGLNASNVAKLLSAKYIYFVPFGQDDPNKKPNSLVARMELIKEACEHALQGKQIQPMIVEKFNYMQ
jgi:dipicolinate synthase subunit B